MIYRQARTGDSLAAAEMFCVSSLCYELPCGFTGEVYGGKRQRPSLLQDLSSDQYVLSHLGSVHVPVRQGRLRFMTSVFKHMHGQGQPLGIHVITDNFNQETHATYS